MVFYSTNGDQELAVFKIKTLLQLLSKHRVNKRNMVFFSTHRAMLDLLSLHHPDRRSMVFCVSNRHQAPAVVIPS